MLTRKAFTVCAAGSQTTREGQFPVRDVLGNSNSQLATIPSQGLLRSELPQLLSFRRLRQDTFFGRSERCIVRAPCEMFRTDNELDCFNRQERPRQLSEDINDDHDLLF